MLELDGFAIVGSPGEPRTCPLDTPAPDSPRPTAPKGVDLEQDPPDLGPCHPPHAPEPHGPPARRGRAAVREIGVRRPARAPDGGRPRRGRGPARCPARRWLPSLLPEQRPHVLFGRRDPGRRPRRRRPPQADHVVLHDERARGPRGRPTGRSRHQRPRLHRHRAGGARRPAGLRPLAAGRPGIRPLHLLQARGAHARGLVGEGGDAPTRHDLQPLGRTPPPRAPVRQAPPGALPGGRGQGLLAGYLGPPDDQVAGRDRHSPPGRPDRRQGHDGDHAGHPSRDGGVGGGRPVRVRLQEGGGPGHRL